MRLTLRAIASLVLILAVAAPVSAATSGGAGEETVTGVLEMAQVDGLGRSPDSVAWTVRSEHRITPVEFDADSPGSLAGARVTVTGSRSNGRLHVPSGRPGRTLKVDARTMTTGMGDWAAETTAGSGDPVAAGAPSPASDIAPIAAGVPVVSRSIAVVMFNFSDLKTQPYTKAQMQDALLNTSSGLKAFFEEESKGRLAVTGAVFGWYTIDATTTGCSWPTWHTLAWNAATAAGVNLDAYTNVMFIWPQTSQCGFAGVGYVPGKYTYLNGTDNVQVMTHEFGHNLGLAHANALSCTSGGTKVMIADPADCTVVQYADPFSTMGNNALKHDHGSQLGELSWLTSAEKIVGSPGNTYTIAPYLGADGVKLVRIPRGDGSYFDLDVRTPYGSFDTFAAGSPAVAGVTIRIGMGTASPTTSPKQTLLLDSTPGTSDLKDAPLLVGKAMTDPVSSISITPLSFGQAGIVVRVREGIAPSAPASISGTGTGDPSALIGWSAATDNVAVGSYEISRDGHALATADASAVGYMDTTAALGATYTYQVTAIDTSGNAGPPASVSVTMPAPPAPPAPDPSATPAPDPSATPAPDPSASPSSDPTPAPDPTATPAPDPTPAAPPSRHARPGRPGRARHTGARGPRGPGRDHDDDHGEPRLGACDGRRRGGRVPGHPQRRAGGLAGRHDLEGHGQGAADELHVYGRRPRCRGEREQQLERDGPDPRRHDPPDDPEIVPQGRALRGVRHVRLGPLHGQREGREVPRLPRWLVQAGRCNQVPENPDVHGPGRPLLRQGGRHIGQPELALDHRPRPLRPFQDRLLGPSRRSGLASAPCRRRRMRSSPCSPAARSCWASSQSACLPGRAGPAAGRRTHCQSSAPSSPST